MESFLDYEEKNGRYLLTPEFSDFICDYIRKNPFNADFNDSHENMLSLALMYVLLLHKNEADENGGIQLSYEQIFSDMVEHCGDLFVPENWDAIETITVLEMKHVIN